MDSLNILQRINEVRKLINYVKKDSSVGTGGGSYRAVSHDAITGMVREHLVSKGVVSYPYLVSSTMNPPIINVDGTQAKQLRYEATYDITFANIDNPEDKIVIRIEAHALDNADKAPGKALSYAKKYAVLKLFEIETGESDESVYQNDGFDFEFYVNLLNSSTSIDELKNNYIEANKEAVKCKDSSALKSLTKLKDELKIKLG